MGETENNVLEHIHSIVCMRVSTIGPFRSELLFGLLIKDAENYATILIFVRLCSTLFFPPLMIFYSK